MDWWMDIQRGKKEMNRWMNGMKELGKTEI